MRGENLDLSGFRDDIIFLNAIGIHTKGDLTDKLQCNPQGVLVVHNDGREERFISEFTFGGPDWGKLSHDAEMVPWPHIQIFSDVGPDSCFDLPLERVGELAKFQDFVNNNSDLCYFDASGEYKDTKLCDDKLIDCCYSYKFQERLHARVSNIAVKKKGSVKLKI